MSKFFQVVVLTAGIIPVLSPTISADDASALDLFRQRITPILRSPNASSCSECHLSGVDLKDYIGKTQEQTFAALRAAGLIDMEQPDKSKLLQFIQRAPEKPTPVSQNARQLEYDAFRAWIRAAVRDPKLAAAQTETDQLGASVPVAIIRHARTDRVLQSFVDSIWSEVGRCVSCHSPEMNRNKIGRNGRTKEDIDAISWVVPRDPAATLKNLVDSGNIDLDDPESSPLLTKPVGLEEHGGGPKFALGSRTDKNFRRFLNDYAAVVSGKYTSADQLPGESNIVAVMTGQHLRIVDLPAEFDGKLLRADIYSRVGSMWSESPWATAENPINGKRQMWQSMVFAIAPRNTDRATNLKPDQPLPPGDYMVRIYVDQHDRMKRDRDYELGEADQYGEVEFGGDWPPGYQPPKIVHAPTEQR